MRAAAQLRIAFKLTHKLNKLFRLALAAGLYSGTAGGVGIYLLHFFGEHELFLPGKIIGRFKKRFGYL